MPIEIKIPQISVLLSLAENEARELTQAAGDSVFEQLVDYLEMLNQERPNQLGGERTNFYSGLAKGTTLEVESGKAVITIPAPFAQRLYGGKIEAKDKLLTIPARAEAYGHRAGDFDDLRFGMFRTTGTMFLAQEDTGLIYFWLKSEVYQEPDPTLLPKEDEIRERATLAIENWVFDKFVQDEAINEVEIGGKKS